MEMIKKSCRLTFFLMSVSIGFLLFNPPHLMAETVAPYSTSYIGQGGMQCCEQDSGQLPDQLTGQLNKRAVDGYAECTEDTEENSGQVDIQGAEGMIGQQCCIPVKINSAFCKIESFGFEIGYDPTILQYSDAVKGDLTASFSVFNVSYLYPGRLRIGGYDYENGIAQGASGTLVLLRFTVIGGQSSISGQSNTAGQGNKCYPLQLENLVDDIKNFTSTGGCLCITSCNGDINGDGNVTPGDALSIFKCYLGSGSCTECSDVTGDGDVTPADALCVFKNYLGQPGCLDNPACSDYPEPPAPPAPEPENEICDGVDNDADGLVDEGVKNTYYQDRDNDGYGNQAVAIQACSAPIGYVTDDTDIDDNDPKIHYLDADKDGISDQLELDGYMYINTKGLLPWDGVNKEHYITDPKKWSSDGDPYGDAMEAEHVNTSATILPPGNHPLVAALPLISLSMESFEVIPLETIITEDGGHHRETFDEMTQNTHGLGVSTYLDVPFFSIPQYNINGGYSYTQNS